MKKPVEKVKRKLKNAVVAARIMSTDAEDQSNIRHGAVQSEDGQTLEERRGDAPELERLRVALGGTGRGRSDAFGAVDPGEAARLNTAILTLQADVEKTWRDWKDTLDPRYDHLFDYVKRYRVFVIEWAQWYASHTSLIDLALGDTEFFSFNARYEAFHVEWTKAGFTTTAPTAPGIPSKPAIQVGVDKVTDLAETATTIAIVAAVGFGLYMLVTNMPKGAGRLRLGRAA
jgi:hypothetical protein